jgi:CxxC motif-containing protein
MKVRTLTCIGCPLGCPVGVTLDDAGEIVRIEGNTCKIGEDYARKEVSNPMRMVTSTVRVRGAKTGAVTASCKTRTDVPKNRIFAVILDIKGITMNAPVHI